MAIREQNNTNERLSQNLRAPTKSLLNSIDGSYYSQSQYDFDYLVFPNDLGMSYNGHYMVININVPVELGGENDRGRYSEYYYTLKKEFSTVDRLRGLDSKGSMVSGGGPNSEFGAIARNTRRIAQSIALFMPNTMVYNTQNAYEDISLTSLAGTVGVGALSGALQMFFNRAGSTAAAFVGSLASAGGAVAGSVAKLAQRPINPRIEVVYATTPQRAFIFEILMVPRNEEESLAIQNIVKTLRFHAAPELTAPIGNVAQGLAFIPPAEFDISFFNMGEENTNIPRINTCVLERIEVDYAPTGMYTTFENGQPVATRLSLAFREIELLHKLRIIEGY